MTSYLIDEEKNKSDIDIALSKINNTSNSITPINSALVKLNMDDIEKTNNVDDNKIEKIEKKLELCPLKDSELYIRKNEISKPIEEVIKVPKINMKDEADILRDEKKRNKSKKEIMEKEIEQDNEIKKKEKDSNEKKIKEFNDKVKEIKILNKRRNIFLFIKFLCIILIITFILICLVIYLDKIL